MSPSDRLTLAMIEAASSRIRDSIRRTPVITSSSLDALSGASLYFKCENLQKTGAFKARGAANAVLSLRPEEAGRGVVTHSSGNHGAALARAAQVRGIPAYIIMPNNAPKAKRAAVQRYGGQILLCDSTLAAREAAAAEVQARTRATFVHPSNDLRVMAGQGTLALEFLEAVPDLDLILCPVGGGGLLSGVAVAAKSARPEIRVIGVEPAGADDAARSLRAGRILPSIQPRTIADGLLTSLGDKTFAEIRAYVDDIVTVSEEAIVMAMRQIWEVMKLVVEPSAAVGYAALVEDELQVADKRVGIVLTGGNLDLDHLPWKGEST